MALQGTAKEAKAKRREQLRLWEESETNLIDLEESQTSRPAKSVKFNQQCVFLASCSAGDKDEVERLISAGIADINTTNVDGLTALHQACIDNNIEMVEFLLDKGIDINIGDNEGWTPLHATASCGYVSIAQLLLERGARLDLVNVDNELAIDRAEGPQMKELLENEARKLGIDTESVRKKEQKLMYEEIKQLLDAQKELPLVVDEKTGATALHVASAKGYTDVIHILLKENQDVHAADSDGWTPLHAAAHWDQKEACLILVKEGFADMEKLTHSGQTVTDVCDEGLLTYMIDLKSKRSEWLAEREKIIGKHKEAARLETNDTVSVSLPPPHVLKRRTSVTRMNSSDRSHLKDASAERISASIIMESTFEEEPSVEVTFDLPTPSLSRCSPPSQSDSTVSTSSSNSTLASATLNLSNSTAGVKRSFMAPVRDEESETQRKAHAKRVRETRRSTQGVTLEDIKTAEENLKMSREAKKVEKETPGNITEQPAPAMPNPMDVGSDSSLERRTSWRERAAAEQRQRQIEDAPHLKIVDSIEAVHHHSDNGSSETDSKVDDNNKENSSETDPALQTRQRRRPKRRSTGICAGGAASLEELPNQLELENSQSRLRIHDIEQRNENRQQQPVERPTDYRILYDQEVTERDCLKRELDFTTRDKERLKELLTEKEEEVLEVKKYLEHERQRRLEAEKRLKDMQNDILSVDTLKRKIETLQEENAALIRVISKLSINNHK